VFEHTIYNVVALTMHNILALWCHPRSMSTAIERLMRARGDLVCLHEPFMYDYYLSQSKRDMPYFEPQAEHAKTYDAVRNMIKQKAQRSPVFIKDMSYYVVSNLATDPEFSQLMTHSFLIRNPQATIASYYALDNEVTLEEIGIEAQWQHYSQLTSLGIKPMVLEAESIASHPQATMASWWHSINLPYVSTAFEWNSETPNDWDSVKTWHQSVMGSTSIKLRTTDASAAELQRYEQALKKAPHLQSYYEHHRPFYKLLRSEVVRR